MSFFTRAQWNVTAMLGRESAYGTPPTAVLNHHLGGNYFMLPAETIEFLARTEKSNSGARAGTRARRYYAPVPGRLWAGGNVRGDMFPDTAALLWYAALGGNTSTPVAHSGNPLGTAADLSAGTITITNPTAANAAYLRFVITAAAGTNPSITVAGTNAAGAIITETLPVTLATGAAIVQTRYNYATVTACTTSGWTSGACTVNGYTRTGHAVSQATDPVSWTIWNLGDPGRGTSQAGRAAGAVMRTLQLDFDASARAGRFTFDAMFEGQAPTYQTVPTVYPSVDRPFAPWNCAVVLGGSTYRQVARARLTFNTGNVLQFTATGDRGPYYVTGGPSELTGNITLHALDDTEFNYYLNNTELSVVLTFSNPDDLLDTTHEKSMVLTLPRCYLSNGQVVDLEGSQALSFDLVPIYNSASSGVLSVAVNNAVHAY